MMLSVELIPFEGPLWAWASAISSNSSCRNVYFSPLKNFKDFLKFGRMWVQVMAWVGHEATHFLTLHLLSFLSSIASREFHTRSLEARKPLKRQLKRAQSTDFSNRLNIHLHIQEIHQKKKIGLELSPTCSLCFSDKFQICRWLNLISFILCGIEETWHVAHQPLCMQLSY